MSESPRLKRPEPERTAPIRGGWLSLFGSPGSPGSPGGPERPRERGGAEEPAREEPAPSDPVARAVDLGYRVVDDYLRQGQDVAKRLGARRAAPSGLGGDVQNLMTRWFQYTSELAEVWFQLVGLAAAGQMPGAPVAPSGPKAASEGAPHARAAASAPGEPTRVAVQVSCSRPVDVLLDLRPVAPETRLRVHDLRAADPEKPRIADVRVERQPDGGALQLQIHIPDAQPPGTYSGLVLDDATSLPAGSVAVRVP